LKLIQISKEKLKKNSYQIQNKLKKYEIFTIGIQCHGVKQVTIPKVQITSKVLVFWNFPKFQIAVAKLD